jgi:anti-sigma regulatory factor (Ser/Thr protein kinase)
VGTLDRQHDDGGDETIEQELPAPPAERYEAEFGPDDLARLRDVVADQATVCGLAGRGEDLVLAVHELAANSVRHGGGFGTLRVWRDGSALVCEVSDRGWITDPLAGRRRPGLEQLGGRGLWLVNQLCDAVELRSSPAGTVVRVRMSGVG